MGKAVGAGVTAAIVLGSIWFGQSQPKFPLKLVGTWMVEDHPELVWTHRSNGTFESRAYFAQLMSYRNVEFRRKGTWSATESTISYYVEEEKAYQDGELANIRFGDVPREEQLRIRWEGPDRYYPTKVSMGAIVRVTSAKATAKQSP